MPKGSEKIEMKILPYGNKTKYWALVHEREQLLCIFMFRYPDSCLDTPSLGTPVLIPPSGYP